jgi:translation initiation factor 2 beta subunit (eIF-2beta)/eIF-5
MTEFCPLKIIMIQDIIESYYNNSLGQLLLSKEIISKLEHHEYTSEEIDIIYVGFTKKYDETLIQSQHIESINTRIESLNFIIGSINDVITNIYQQKREIKEIDNISFEEIYKNNCGYNGMIDGDLSTIFNWIDELESSLNEIKRDIHSYFTCGNLPEVIDEINELIDKLSKPIEVVIPYH